MVKTFSTMITNKRYNVQFYFIFYKNFEFKHVKASKTFQPNIFIFM